MCLLACGRGVAIARRTQSAGEYQDTFCLRELAPGQIGRGKAQLRGLSPVTALERIAGI
ncbi:MAG TPA: hypothetical protein VHB01_02520 [Nitrosospira sp.]|nr:hypothetical protein [Nitrosospira sp.]